MCKLPITSLEPEETSDLTHRLYTYRAYILHRYASESLATDAALALSDDCFTRKQAERVQDCRTAAWFVRHRTTGEVRIAANHCRHRWCPLCATALRNWRTQAVLRWITNDLQGGDLPRFSPGIPLVEPQKSPGRALEEPGKSPGRAREEPSKPPRSCKFVTLTKHHNKAPLEHQIDNLYKQFQQLRKQPLMKKACRGGVWFFQITRSKADGLWHPHLHLLIEADYIPQRELSRLWAKITHTSKIVDIRAVRRPQKTALYVSRYSSRPCQLAGLTPSCALEVIESLHSRRIVGTWGTARGIPMTPKPTGKKEDWQYVAAFEQVNRLKTVSDRFARVWHAWRKSLPLQESDTRESAATPAFHDATANETETPFTQIPLLYPEAPT